MQSDAMGTHTVSSTGSCTGDPMTWQPLRTTTITTLSERLPWTGDWSREICPHNYPPNYHCW